MEIWAQGKKSRWIKFVNKLIAAEISTTTRFCDKCVQVAPLAHDDGYLYEAVECPEKGYVEEISQVENHRDCIEKRNAYILNGNFNYTCDIQQQLEDLHVKLSRHSRVFLVVYNPFMGFLYKLAGLMKIRKAPQPEVYLTENSLITFAKLAGYEIVRTRPSVFLPFYIPLLSNIVNRLFTAVPFIRRFSFIWVVVLRPLIQERTAPSLSIIIPARNEAGNIAAAIKRMPVIPDAKLEIIFVEGNSTDDTWEQIKKEVEKPNERLTVSAYQQPGKGKNDAVQVGFAKATGDLVTILDADLTMPPEMIPRFYDAYCKGSGDFVNGSRLLYPMEVEAMRPLNHVGNLFFCKMLAWVLDIPISDSLCGTKLFPLQDYNRIVAWRERFGAFDPFGDFDMLFASAELALGVIDLPIQYRARTYGDTNISRFTDGLRLIKMTAIGFWRIRLGKSHE